MHRLLPLFVLSLALWPSTVVAQGGPCSVFAAGSRAYADWSGPWASHARTLTIAPEGCGSLVWNDGMAGFVLDARSGASTSGRIILISDQQAIRGDGIELTLNDDGTLTAEWDGEPRVFCRTWDWRPERCGA